MFEVVLQTENKPFQKLRLRDRIILYTKKKPIWNVNHRSKEKLFSNKKYYSNIVIACKRSTKKKSSSRYIFIESYSSFYFFHLPAETEQKIQHRSKVMKKEQKAKKEEIKTIVETDGMLYSCNYFVVLLFLWKEEKPSISYFLALVYL